MYKCPVCSSSNIKLTFDKMVNAEVMKCQECGAIFYNESEYTVKEDENETKKE